MADSPLPVVLDHGAFPIPPGKDFSLQMQVPAGLTANASATGGNLSTGPLFYRVTAFDGSGNNGLAGTTGNNETTPSAEITVNVSATATGAVFLGCNPVPGAAGYVVYRGTAPDQEVFYDLFTTNLPPSYVDTGHGTPNPAIKPPKVNSASVFKMATSGGDFGERIISSTYGFISGLYLSANPFLKPEDPNGNANPTDISSTGSAIGLANNRLFGAESGRYTVSYSGATVSPGLLWDGNYDSPGMTINAAATGVVTVDFNPQMQWSANTNTGFVYGGGMICLTFFPGNVPTNIKVEYYSVVNGTDKWTTVVDIRSLSTVQRNNNVFLFPDTVPGNYLKKIRFTFWHPTAQVLVTEVEWVGSRDTTEQPIGLDQSMIPVVPRYANETIDLGIPQINVRDKNWTVKASVLADGSMPVFHGDSTGGNTLASVVYANGLTGQTTNIAASSMFTPPTPGLYRASIYMVDTTAGAAGTTTATISWNDDQQAQTFTTSTLALSSLGAFVQSTVCIEAKTTAPIKFSTTVTGAIGGPQYSIYVALERLS